MFHSTFLSALFVRISTQNAIALCGFAHKKVDLNAVIFGNALNFMTFL